MPAPDLELVRRVLSHYPVGDTLDIRRHSGTAAPTWRVRTRTGTWLLRTRGVRTQSDEALAFDHGLRRHLVEHGVPTAAPVETRSGPTFVRVADRAYELYSFVLGHPLDDAPAAALGHAARALAEFHRAGETFPPARTAPALAQYATLGVPDASIRMEDPELLAQVYARLLGDTASSQFGHAVDVCRRWIARLRCDFGPRAYESLPHALTHGDYTQANLLFDDAGAVVGIFDLDWARWAPRVRDIGDGMYFIAAARRSPLHIGDIWSLTETADFDLGCCREWLDAYANVSPLSQAEIHAVPLAFGARWLSVRAEGMAKVPAEDRLRFCFRGLAEPLCWIEEHWGEATQALL